MKTTPPEHEYLTEDGIEVYEEYWNRHRTYGIRPAPFILYRARGILLDEFNTYHPEIREYKALKFLIDNSNRIEEEYAKKRHLHSRRCESFVSETINETKGREILTECGAESNETP